MRRHPARWVLLLILWMGACSYEGRQWHRAIKTDSCVEIFHNLFDTTVKQ